LFGFVCLEVCLCLSLEICLGLSSSLETFFCLCTLFFLVPWVYEFVYIPAVFYDCLGPSSYVCFCLCPWSFASCFLGPWVCLGLWNFDFVYVAGGLCLSRSLVLCLSLSCSLYNCLGFSKSLGICLVLSSSLGFVRVCLGPWGFVWFVYVPGGLCLSKSLWFWVHGCLIRFVWVPGSLCFSMFLGICFGSYGYLEVCCVCLCPWGFVWVRIATWRFVCVCLCCWGFVCVLSISLVVCLVLPRSLEVC